MPGLVAVALGATFGFWILHQRNAAPPEWVPPPVVVAASKPAANPYGELVDPGTFVRSAPVSVAKSDPTQFGDLAPLSSAAPQADSTRTLTQLGASVPLPPPRPRQLAGVAEEPERQDRQSPRTVVASAPADDRNFLQRLLGLPAVSGATATYAAAPAARAGGDLRQGGVSSYAQAGVAGDPRQSGALGILRSATESPTGRYDQYTAVYDLTAHVLYLPDGRRLEAHSGLGDRLDDPRHVDERMRGATPPHLYELTVREGSFHGVQALRLNPIGEGGIYGRAGLLAHPFMLGPNGDSNGCVSIREYDAFLEAYQRGQIKRLAVVASLR